MEKLAIKGGYPTRAGKIYYAGAMPHPVMISLVRNVGKKRL